MNIWNKEIYKRKNCLTSSSYELLGIIFIINN